jgi:effector-binding domain-containing protein
MTYPVELVDEPTRTVARRRTHVSGATVGEAIGSGIVALFDFAERRGVEPVGPPIVSFQGEVGLDREFDLEVYLPLVEKVDGDGDVDVVQLMGGPSALLIYQGPYEEMQPAYEAIHRWIAEHGYEPAGPHREVYLITPDEVRDPCQHVTEIYVPVQSRIASS